MGPLTSRLEMLIYADDTLLVRFKTKECWHGKWAFNITALL